MSALELTHAEQCRTLAAQAGMATLCTRAVDPEGFPYGSLTQFAADADGNPLLLLSELAEHTVNLRANRQASLLVWQPPGELDPLAAGRATFFGEIEPAPPELLDLYLEKLPEAKLYAAFKDFSLWRLPVFRIRYVGGFGAMSWVSGDDYRAAQPDPVAPRARGIVEHMNEDHTDALVELVKHQLGKEASEVRMVSCDGAGYGVRLDGKKEVHRLSFSRRLTTSDEVRKEFIAQLGAARRAQ